MTALDSCWMRSPTVFRPTPVWLSDWISMIMLMTGADSIRDVIAFPKVKDASDLMTEAPTPVDDKQLEELSLKVVTETEE